MCSIKKSVFLGLDFFSILTQDINIYYLQKKTAVISLHDIRKRIDGKHITDTNSIIGNNNNCPS